MDTIADMFSRIKTSLMRKKEILDMPSAKLKQEISRILKEEGFIENYEVLVKGGKKHLRIRLKYAFDKYGKIERGVITNLKRVSKSSRRIYTSAREIPRVMGGFGILLVSTSAGLMTDSQARAKKIGGEIIGSIW